MFTADELSAIRAEFEDVFLDASATLTRKAKTPNPAGGRSTTSTTTSTVPCCVNPLSKTPIEGVHDSRMTSVADFVVMVPADTDVDPATDSFTVDGQVFEVLATDAGSTTRALLACLCRRVSA